MSEQLLDLLKLGLLILLYLFFLRVMWAVFRELRAPVPVAGAETTAAPGAPSPTAAAAGRTRLRPAKRTSKPRAGPPVLRVATPPELAGTEHQVVGEMTIGRAPGCAIVVLDTYASQMHARVFLDDAGRPVVEDLGSTNGTFCNGEPVTAARILRRGDRLQIGDSSWELA